MRIIIDDDNNTALFTTGKDIHDVQKYRQTLQFWKIKGNGSIMFDLVTLQILGITP